MPVIAFGALEWHNAPMPGSNGPVELARLPQLDDQAFRAFVRFPAGWARPGAGHYAVPEEFLILDGDLSLNGITWKTGGYAWIPAHRVRSGSVSVDGCLAFAWFGGPPRWVAGEALAPTAETDVIFAHWRDAPQREMDDHSYARELRVGSAHSTWLVEQARTGILPEFDASFETLRLRDRVWSCDKVVATMTDGAGALLLRVASHRTLRNTD